MFTGLVEAQGQLVFSEASEGGLLLVLATDSVVAEDMQLGDSVAVNGLCLSVVAIVGTDRRDASPSVQPELLKRIPAVGAQQVGLAFDVIPESLKRSNLGLLRVGDCVNLELSLRLNARLGGHMVSGHIDCVAQVIDFKRNEESILTLELPENPGHYLMHKGSVAINGVSLTIASVHRSEGSPVVRMDLCLIPVTLGATNLASLQPGDTVNIEIDQIARMVVDTVHRLHSP
ncbi:MAG: riboflavin synthase [Gammaproteobacteria bacterium]